MVADRFRRGIQIRVLTWIDFLPIGEEFPILITFGLEDSSSSGISLTLDDLPRRTTLGLEDDVRLELGPEEVKVPVLDTGGM